MREHTISWYEANDGRIFLDEMECCNYELNLLYKKSGVSFYIGKERIEWLTDDSYNDMTDIFVDHTKAAENKALYDFLRDNYGWCYVEDVLERPGSSLYSHYRFSESPFEPIQEVE